MQNNKYLFIIFSILMFCFCYSATGQTDTIYIYEDVVVYDTIYVHDTIFEKPDVKELFPIKPKLISILQLDTVNFQANLLLISNQQSATIFINHIILDENFNKNIKNLESMKKLSFLGVVLFAFQNLVFSQIDYGIAIGGGTWWANSNRPIVNGVQISEPTMSANYSIGLNLKYQLKKNFTLESQINYRLMLKNKSYDAYYIDNNQNTMLWEENDWLLAEIWLPIMPEANHQPVEWGNSKTNYHCLEIPFNIGYKLRKFNPYIGFRYTFKWFKSYSVVPEYHPDLPEFLIGYKRVATDANRMEECFGLQAGLNYNIFHHLVVKLNYYQGISKDYNYDAKLVHFDKHDNMSTISKSNYFWKTRSLEISFIFSLRKD